MTLADDIAGWIADHVRGAGLDGSVLGLSGGIDSAVVSGLKSRPRVAIRMRSSMTINNIIPAVRAQANAGSSRCSSTGTMNPKK